MAKTTSAADYRKKSVKELKDDLNKIRTELQTIRFTKSSGTAVAKLSKIKILRKQIARILTIIRENNKNEVIKKIGTKVTFEGDGETKKEIETKIKNLKMKHIPLDLRPKRTRAIRRRMTKFESKLVTLRQLKRKLNFPMRKFAVPAKQ